MLNRYMLGLIIVQFVFLFFGFILTGAGHGTYTQFPMFYGIFFLPVSFGFVYENFYQTIVPYLISMPLIFLLLSVVIMHRIRSSLYHKKFIKTLAYFHFIGGVLSIVITEFFGNYPLSPDPKIKLVGIIIGTIFSILFWRILLNATNEQSSRL